MKITTIALFAIVVAACGSDPIASTDVAGDVETLDTRPQVDTSPPLDTSMPDVEPADIETDIPDVEPADIETDVEPADVETDAPEVEQCPDCDIAKVVIGGAATCALTRGGRLSCWGENYYYPTVGAGTEGAVPRPTLIPGTWSTIASGGVASCGIQGGALFCWGLSEAIFGDDQPRLSPAQIGADTDWTDVVSGNEFVCGLRTGVLYCWGSNGNGQLGLGDNAVRTSPTAIPDITGWSSIVAGYSHMCGLVDGALYCWGDFRGPAGGPLAPVRLGEETWTAVAIGAGQTCALRSDGEVHCVGYNFDGALGTGDLNERTELTREVTSSTWTSLTAGGYGTCATKDDGAVWCWGTPQLPNQTKTETNATPTAVPDLDNYDLFTLGDTTACGVNGATLACWGQPSAAIGDGTTRDVQPTLLEAPTGVWSSLDGGGENRCGIADGALYCWGFSDRGALGLGTTQEVWSPTQVGSDRDWDIVDVGSNGGCGIRAGALYCWGWNRDGGVGDGTKEQRDVPVRIGTATNWTAIRVGTLATCGLQGQQLFCWGSNDDNQSSAVDGDVLTPTPMGTPRAWSRIAVGSRRSCGLEGGALYCWGRDFSGIEQVGSLTSWTDLDAQHNWSYGIAAGELYDLSEGVTKADPNAGWTQLRVDAESGVGIRDGAVYGWGRFSESGGIDTTIDPLGIVGTWTGLDAARLNFALKDAAGWYVAGLYTSSIGLGDRFSPTVIPLPE